MVVTTQGDEVPTGTWLIFNCSGFQSEAEAQFSGKKFGDALLMAGATGNLGIDIGFSRSTLQFSDQIHQAVKKEFGRELRAEMHGLMTFEENTVRVVGLNATGSVSMRAEALNERLIPWIAPNIIFTERQRNCSALLNDSFFVPSAEAQFLLRISAIEALCDQTLVEGDQQSAIDGLKEYLATLKVQEKTRLSLENTLKYARRLSVGQAVKLKIEKLLSTKEAASFKCLYDLRSKLLHDGQGRGSLSRASSDALQLGTDLLKAELDTVVVGLLPN